ncbi:MAG: hypothetical protein HKO05_02755 [Erythrobacter sp.]|nr:hypothetical protein [Erythrobacter sp.]
MNTLVSKALVATAAVALSVTALSPAIAQSADEILVTPSGAMQNWRADVSRDLSRQLDQAESFAKYNPQPGIVQVRFTLDDNGRPVGMGTYRTSGSISSDRAARWAVRRLTNLDDVPVRVKPGTTFQANVIFAETPAQRDQLAKKLAWIESKRLANASAEAGVIALGS